MPNLVDSFRATNNFLAYLCICPFHIDKRTGKLESCRRHIVYHMCSLVIYECVLLFSAYFKFLHGMHTSLSQGSVLITWIMLARSFTIGVLLSLANRNGQIALFNRFDAFDRLARILLNRSLGYNHLIRQMILINYTVFSYNYVVYIALALYYKDNFNTVLFYMCCTHADVYFSIYLLYISFWAKLYVQRLMAVNDGLERLLHRRRILHKAMENLLDLYNDIFDIRSLIEKTFGSILFYTIFYHSLTIAVAIYALINSCMLNVHNFYEDLVSGLLWLVPLCLRGWYLVHVFHPFGDEVFLFLAVLF